MRSAVQGTSLDDASAHFRPAAVDAGAGPCHSRTQSGTGAFMELSAPACAAGRIRRVGRDRYAVGQH